MSRIVDGSATLSPRLRALGCHVHFEQQLGAHSWKQSSVLDMSKGMLEATTNGCAWGLRDPHGSLLNRSWRVLTTSPDIQRVLNHRRYDKRHIHGSLCDHYTTIPAQFRKSLCETLAKPFLAKDCWQFVVGILEHLHPDDDERPHDPSASSWDTPIELNAAQPDMEIDHEDEAASPAPLVVEASPTAFERRDITNWLQNVHRQIGHRDNRTLVRFLKQRGTHPWVLKMAQEFRCSSCEESKPPNLRHITSSYENVPGAILEIDGMHWQHPVTGHHARCQFMVDVGSRAPMVTFFEEPRERSSRNNNTTECKDSLLKDWIVHRGRPGLIRMDPGGCHMSTECSTLCTMTLESTPRSSLEKHLGDCPSVIMRLVKRTARIYALDQGRAASCQECLLQAVMAHTRLLKHGGYTPLYSFSSATNRRR